MVERVGQDEAVRKQGGDRRNGRKVGNPARGEDQGRLLAVQVGELSLKLDDAVMRAGNVARAAGARAMPLDRGDRRFPHLGMPAHAEIVVRAPDRHFARFARRVGAPQSSWEPGRITFKVYEDAIASLAFQALDGAKEMLSAIRIGHGHQALRAQFACTRGCASAIASDSAFRESFRSRF